MYHGLAGWNIKFSLKTAEIKENLAAPQPLIQRPFVRLSNPPLNKYLPDPSQVNTFFPPLLPSPECSFSPLPSEPFLF